MVKRVLISEGIIGKYFGFKILEKGNIFSWNEKFCLKN